MKNILITISGYLPASKYGGPVTSIANLIDSMHGDFNFFVLTSNHDLHEKKVLDGINNDWNDVGFAKVKYLDDKEFCSKTFKKVLIEKKIDIVYISSLFSVQLNIPAILAAKKMRVPVIISPRGELKAQALRISKAKKSLFIGLMKSIHFYKDVFFHVTSDEELYCVASVLNIKETNIFNIANMPCRILNKESEDNKDITKFVFISRIHEIKNLNFILRILSKIKSPMQFDIYGPIEQQNYWDLCLETIDALPNNIEVSYKGAVEPGKSQEIFSKYDCFLFPTLSENYGNAIAEAISAGCHVVLSKGTTPWDDIHENGGFAISLPDEELWIQCIENIISMDKTQRKIFDLDLINYANRKLKIDQVKNEYSNMFNIVCEEM